MLSVEYAVLTRSMAASKASMSFCASVSCDLALELVVERFLLDVDVGVDDRRFWCESLNIVVVLRIALAVEHEIGVSRDELLEIRLAVRARVENFLVVPVADALWHEVARCYDEFDPPGLERAEDAIVGRSDSLGGGGNFDAAASVGDGPCSATPRVTTGRTAPL